MSTGLIEEMAALAHHDAHVTHSYPEWKHAHLSYAREVVPLLDNFTHAMTAVGYSHKDVYGMRLALEEAIVNALRHGNKSDPSKRVFVRYCVRPDQALAEVEDQGEGFNPDQVPNPLALENLKRPGGRGLLLIHHYTTWSRYNKEGNRLTLCKRPSQ
jgi:serine/threonine-protein kinase RsbW